MERDNDRPEVWRKDYNVLWSAQTQDGQTAMFLRKHGQAQPGRGWIALEVGEHLTWFPEHVVEHIGGDSLAGGLVAMGEALEQINCSTTELEQESPIMADFVHPIYGSPENYHTALLMHTLMTEALDDVLARQPAG
jgi:hypothetical protein